MKTSLETLSPTRVKLIVEVPFEELADQLAAAYKRIASQITVPGFRRGKVPARVIDQRVGRGAVLEEAVNEALPKLYESAVAEHDVFVLGRPEVDVTDLVDGTVFGFTAEVDIRPDFELPDYTGIEIAVDDAVVTEQEVTDQLDSLRKRFATARPVERAAAPGDLIYIDMEGKVADEPVEDYTLTSFSYEVGSDELLPGADAAVTGLSAGESAEFTLTPDQGPHAGADVSLRITVNSVHERELPVLDDEFAQLSSEFDTIAELQEDLRARLGKMRLVEQGYAAKAKVLDALLELIEIPVPEGVVAEQVAEHLKADKQGGHDHHHHHHDPDADAGTDGDDPDVDEELRAELAEDARRSLRTQFILDKIADAEELAVTQAELTQWLISQASRYGMAADRFADALVKAGEVQSAVADVRRGKAVALVLEKASITDESGNAIDLSLLTQTQVGSEDDIEADDIEADEDELGDDTEDGDADKPAAQ